MNSSHVAVVDNFNQVNDVGNSDQADNFSFGLAGYSDQINQTENSSHSAQTNLKRRLIEFIGTSILGNNFTFREFHYATTLVKKALDEKTKSCCLNTDCSLSIDERVYIDKTFSEIEVKQLIASLLIRNIKNIIHNFSEYIVVDVFMNNYIKKNDKKLSTIDKFSVKIVTTI